MFYFTTDANSLVEHMSQLGTHGRFSGSEQRSGRYRSEARPNSFSMGCPAAFYPDPSPSGESVTSYKRGYRDGVWDRYWHWNDRCEDYPTGTCLMQKDKPTPALLCLRCLALDRPD
jgi:hypothetical protein